MTSWFPQTWSDCAALVAVITFAGSVIYFAIRMKLGGEFVQRDELMELHKQNVETINVLHGDHGKLIHRVNNVEQKMQALPTRADLQRTEDQVREISANIGKLTGEMSGMTSALDRTFTQIQVLIRANIADRERD